MWNDGTDVQVIGLNAEGRIVLAREGTMSAEPTLEGTGAIEGTLPAEQLWFDSHGALEHERCATPSCARGIATMAESIVRASTMGAVEGADIARHPRSYEGDDMVFDPLHYLPLIERKIRALDQAAPLAGWELPDAFATLRRLMEARSGRAGRREYVQVLRLFETFGTHDVHAAVRHALRVGAIGFDAVKHLVLCRVEKRPPKLDLDVYPYRARLTGALLDRLTHHVQFLEMNGQSFRLNHSRARKRDATT